MTSPSESPASHSTLLAIAAFEGSLVFVAAFAGWLFGIDPLAMTAWSLSGLGWGVIATLPLLAILLVSVRLRWSPFVRIRETLDTIVLQFLHHAGWIEIAAISILAGLGEEMLFRGVMQAGIAEWIGGNGGIAAGLVTASLLFGAAHPVHVPYFVMVTLMGLYLGGLFLYFENLLVPIVVHALYDFVAILYVRSRLPRDEAVSEEEAAEEETAD